MGLRLAHPCFARALLITMLGLPGLSPSARAQDGGTTPEAARGPMSLHWVRMPGAENCIAGDALARVVESKLRRSVFPAPRDASVLIEGHVQKSPDGFVAELQMRDAKGETLGSRNLSSSDGSCRELSETLGVVLAVMIDPDAAKRPPSAIPAEPEPKAQDGGAAKREPKNHMLVFSRTLVGLTDKAMIGFGAAYERALGRAGGVRVEASIFLENTDDSPQGDAKTMTRVAYAGLAYCPLWLGWSRARLAGCAGLELGGVSASNTGLAPADDPHAIWGSASLGLRLAVLLVGPIELHVAAGGLGKFGKLLVVNNEQDGHDPILPKNNVPLAGLFDLGLGARF
jgi:hypothetical protein